MKTFKILAMAAVLFSGLTGISFGDINAGLQAWYAFNGNANDGSGNGYDGTVYNATLTNDHFGNSNSAYYFNGSNAYIGMGNPAGLNFTGTITIAAWVRSDVVGGTDINRDIVEHGYGGYPVQAVYFRTANGGQYEIGSYIQYGSGTGRATYTVPSADVGNWVHLAGLYDGAAWKLYRNGTQVASNPIATGAIQVDENWAIGASGIGDRFFTGAIDDVRIYNRALSAAEIQQLVPEPCTILLLGLGGVMLKKKR